ncbi:S-layer homology domain-containing protein [Paenibacillus contaminans]|uniref:SLH domain-containing protein n=1 Tax=Paenibacillus contaminans TaxID=450362 RepID=A0A329M937_9BACL|nr:S-layer homology domain-containing protein [Paenibacillus contaminans]RAV16400.1 hypothetical protein DQG23_28720 [Paenibacillus contaminans]
MTRKLAFISTLILLTCLPFMVLKPAYAETTPSFHLTANQPVDGKITITMSGKNITDLYGYEAKFTFDPNDLELAEATSDMGGFSAAPIVTNNEILIAHSKIGNKPGESGDFKIGTLNFIMKRDGNFNVKWTSMRTITHDLSDRTYSVNDSVSVHSQKKSFVDLEGHWAKEDIELLASKGIIKGISEDRFAPEALVTRAEFATLVSRALDLKAADTTMPFTDVASSSWYKDAINRSYAAGIVHGITDTRFAPDQNITREEMAVMLIRAIKLSPGAVSEGGTDRVSFADSDAISEWARADIETAVQLGIMTGRAEEKFIPDGLATRAEAATVIKRLMSSSGLL